MAVTRRQVNKRVKRCDANATRITLGLQLLLPTLHPCIPLLFVDPEILGEHFRVLACLRKQEAMMSILRV